MASQVFYRKWRSQTLSELVGQPHVTQTLLNALKNGNISHAYLFCGPRGTGKTSTARILAKAVNCLNNGKGEPCNTCEMCRAITEDRAMDVIEIDAASNRGIDDIRDLREKVNYAPTQARRKVYIIDEFHMLSKDASNALLKTLEEPPVHVIFVLATTESNKVLPTILSRCQHFDFHRLSLVDVVAKLSQVCSAEKINIEQQSLKLIARSSTGSLRDAYNLLEQLTTHYGSDIKFQQLQSLLGITGDYRAKEIVKQIVNNDLSAGMSTLIAVNNDGLDLRQFNRELVNYLRELLLVKTGASASVDIPVEDINDLKDLAEKSALSKILSSIKIFGQIEMGNNDNTTLPLELALVECYLGQPEKPQTSEKVEDVPQFTLRTATRKFSVESGVSSKAKTELIDTSDSRNPELGKKSEPDNKPGDTISSQKQEIEPPVFKGQEEKGSGFLSPTLTSEIERLRLNWKQILENPPSSVRKNSPAIALLRTIGPPLTVENDIVTLSAKSKIFKDNIEKPENLKAVETIFQTTLGHSCKVVCILDEKKHHLVNQAIKMGAQITSVEEK
jgi:DNA polymerase III subunit gamma/tau